MSAALKRVEALARGVGRLRLHDVPDYVVDRLAAQVEALDVMLHPTAAEIARRFALVSDGDTAVDEALAIVDARSDRLRRLLGTKR